MCITDVLPYGVLVSESVTSECQCVGWCITIIIIEDF